MLSDLRDFAAAVLNYWLDMAGGGVLAVIGWWVWPYMAKSLRHPEWVDAVPSQLIWAAIAAGLFSAFFRAWRRQYHATKFANRELLRLTKPILEGSIPQFVIGSLSLNSRILTMISTNIYIMNRGAPSIVGGWRAFAMVNNQRYDGEVWTIPDGLNLEMPSGSRLILGQKDAIYNKAATDPVPTGGAISGWLQIAFETLPFAMVNGVPSPLSVTVQFLDVASQNYEVVGRSHGVLPRPKYVPDGLLQ
jgi:hypothetical protein